MRRRELLVGAAALFASAPAWGQPGRRPIIGFLNSQSPEAFAHLVAAFHSGLAEGGYEADRNVSVFYRWASGQYEIMPLLAAELVDLGVDAIFTGGGNPSVLAAHAATTTIPIVFVMGGDPVALGLAASLNRPGANITGVAALTGALDQKRLGYLHELLPAVRTVTVLHNPAIGNEGTDIGVLEEAADILGIGLRIVSASTAPEIDTAFTLMAAAGTEALLIGTDPFFYSRREQVVALATQHAIPAMYTQREYVLGGGLISYSASLPSVYRLAGGLMARILNGENPGEIPIAQDYVFDFVINLHTAAELGVTVPFELLALATEIIE